MSANNVFSMYAECMYNLFGHVWWMCYVYTGAVCEISH